VEGGIALGTPKLSTRQRQVVSLMTSPLPLVGKENIRQRLGRTANWSGCCGGKNKCFPLPGIEHCHSSCSPHSLVTVLIE